MFRKQNQKCWNISQWFVNFNNYQIYSTIKTNSIKFNNTKFANNLIVYLQEQSKHKMLEEQVYSFAGGPTMLPRKVISELKQSFLSNSLFGGAGFLDVDPQSEEFKAIHQEAEKTVRQLLSVPENYRVWFTPAGAHLQFASIPLNLLQGKDVVNYTLTGYFSNLSVQEAEKYCKVNRIAELKQDEHKQYHLPDPSEYKIDPNAPYIHYIDNQSVQGIEYTPKTMPYHPGQFLLNDCSSNFLTKPIDWTKTSMAYAHTQKNCGISGSTIMIVDDRLLNTKKDPRTPYVCDYSKYTNGYPSTEMVQPIILNYYCLKYIKQIGGVGYTEHNSALRSKKLYDVLDSSHGFYNCDIRKDCRSRINVTWKMPDSNMEKLCIEEGAKQGLYEFKGHRSRGGFRASLFVPVPNEGVDKLIDFLSDFMVKHQ